MRRKFSAEACVTAKYLAKHHLDQEGVEQNFVEHSCRLDDADADFATLIQIFAIDDVHVVFVFELFTRSLLRGL